MSPAPHPFIIERELTPGFHTAAELSVSRLTREGSGIELVDAIGADLIRAVQKALAEFALKQHALFCSETRTKGRVVIGSNGPIERGFDSNSVGRHRAEARHQEPRLALDGRIRR